MFYGVDIIGFVEYFKSDLDCKKYLYTLKWENGFRCRKCGNDSWSKTKDPFIHKCNKCKHKESVTAGTLFHKCKFSLRKAFMIIYYMSTTKKGISSYELSRQLNLRQKTCWLFQQKVRRAMSCEGEPLLDSNVAVDEFMIGGREKGKQGRSKGKKKEVVIAIKYEGEGIHTCYARKVENCGTKQLRPFFEDHISREAKVKSDKWRGYRPLKTDYQQFVQIHSKQGQNFPLIHRQIMMLKGWLRGIYHHCSHAQQYLDEFCFRFNERFNLKTIFHDLVSRMMYSSPTTYKDFRVLWGN